MRIYSDPILDEDFKTVAYQIQISESFEKLTDPNKIHICEFILMLVNQAEAGGNHCQVLLDCQYMPVVDQLPPKIGEMINYVAGTQQETDLIEKRNYHSFSIHLTPNFDGGVIPAKARFVLINKQHLVHFKQDLKQLLNAFKVIVQDIETYEEIEIMQKLSIDYYQGHFYALPLLEEKQEAGSANQQNIIQLIAKLNDPNADFEDISDLIISDNILSYQLLKVINCPIYRGRNEITSIQAAVVRFGLKNLKNWGTTLSLSCYSYKPQALFYLSLQRAMMCLKLAQFKLLDDPDSYYTAGLLSTLDAFLDTPLEELLKGILLPEVVYKGILEKEGTIGDVLSVVEKYQTDQNALFNENITSMYIDSVKACNEMLHSLNS